MNNQKITALFAVIVESCEARSGYNDSIMTKAGDKFLVTVEPEGWVEATSSQWNGSLRNSNGFPHKPKMFDSREAAEKFAKRWKGHPWWCRPNGNFDIIEIEPVFKQVPDGYAIAKAHGIGGDE